MMIISRAGEILMTTKKVDPTAVINDYINSVIEKEGGREALLKKLTAEKLTTLIAETSWDSTLGQLDKAAQQNGLLDSLKALTLKELRNIIAPPKKPGRKSTAAKKTAKPKKGKKKKKRGASYMPILSFLAKKPNSSSAEIQKGTGIDSKAMGPKLQYLGPKMKLISGKGKLKRKTWSISAKGKKYLEGK
jgi:hypothetical protein